VRVAYHAEFARDINRFAAQYGDISGRLQERFRVEVDLAIARIHESPGGAGHYISTGSRIIKEARRRNLQSFPFFVLYSVNSELLLFGALIPQASDPLTWLRRLKGSGRE
jgi:hypothetical protein